MAFIHGKGTAFYINGFSLSAFYKKVSKKPSGGANECTTFGSNSKKFIGGIKDATWTAEGYFDATLVTGVDVVMQPLIGVTSTLVTEFPGGELAIGTGGYAWRSVNTQHDIPAPVKDVVALMSGGQVTDDFERVKSVHVLGAETAGSNSASLDNGASSAAGASAYLHVTAFTGTNITIKVQHSTDNASWSDLIVFSAATVAGTAQRAAAAGTINRYVRTLWSGTFTTATFSVAFSRF